MDADRNRQLVRWRAWRPKNGQWGALRRRGADGRASAPCRFHSVVRVTDLKTHRQVTVRINDRGPFIDGRVIDLSLAAAKALEIWKPGLATVKLEVLHTPAAIDIGGKVVRAGRRLPPAKGALDLQQSLAARYQPGTCARNSPGPPAIGCACWCRTTTVFSRRKLASSIKASEGGVFLVRLD